MINYSGDFQTKKDVQINNLPAGVYVGVVRDAEVTKEQIAGREVERLVLRLDVAEGEYKDHYQKAFDAASGGMYPARYKGVYKLNIPYAGDPYEGMNKRILQGAAWAFEQSNSGYHWDWDERRLKGLSVGFSVREADYLIEDKDGIRTGTTTEICKLESVSDVKAGAAKMPKRRELKEAQKQKLEAYNVLQKSTPVEVDEEEVPF